ncbi:MULTISPECIES: GntR family transcriptional regulator [Planococcus]|uniref:GntR family transcriptional regulator n=2 Tax=Planococcus TaxID=1372 RepID=A0ABM5X041_9BACL|nr:MULTISPECIES: GntR family transcriptional regulator [Planococcus]ALS79985.1 GntR family transcriptional regulator [Planococcus kocurii]AQU78032.1 GntR family transcriptional regulator [Planococcus faecalis]KAA0957407.1 GntR family transcriptional regulator [Planococcus sp. ANT_H30]MDJ0331347.1 GntR family transcriptional regulator [Planococcus sp. S3-L1]
MPIPVNHAKPVRVSAKESAYLQLQQWIIDGTLQPEEKLIDTELAQALSLSRTPIREALQLLEVQGFVEMFPGKATRVTTIKKGDLKDLLPPLAVLQALSAELAIPNLDEHVFRLLEETNQRFIEAIESQNGFSALKIDQEFHQIIVDAADNPYIHSILSSLQSHVRRQFFHHSLMLTKSSYDEHVEIIQTLKEKNPTKVTQLMKSNWIRTIDELSTEKLL